MASKELLAQVTAYFGGMEKAMDGGQGALHYFILSIRLYAVYGGSRALVLALGIFLLTGIAGTSTILGLTNFSAMCLRNKQVRAHPQVSRDVGLNYSMRFYGLQNVHDIQEREVSDVIGYVDEGQCCGSHAYQLHHMVYERDPHLHWVRNKLMSTLASVGRLQSVPQWVVVSS
ncbi:hypothetical protein BU17DRAFT_70791 [Hysterangium stoloniferum]|nr:hypothetical protein BU17DRAFT_70791 [Hysterangium stoloniferum]